MPDERTTVLPVGTPAHPGLLQHQPLKYQPTAMEQMLEQEGKEVRALQSIAKSLKFFVVLTCIVIGLSILAGALLFFVDLHNTTTSDNRVIVSSSQGY
jgi:multisubunit Na+/H+ antiporter MnhC subunit